MENNTDQMFRDRLEPYSSPVNGEVLERIFRERQKRKKRPFAWWYLLPVLLGLAGAGYFIFVQPSQQHENAVAAITPGNSSEINPEEGTKVEPHSLKQNLKEPEQTTLQQSGDNSNNISEEKNSATLQHNSENKNKSNSVNEAGDVVTNTTKSNITAKNYIRPSAFQKNNSNYTKRKNNNTKRNFNSNDESDDALLIDLLEKKNSSHSWLRSWSLAAVDPAAGNFSGNWDFNKAFKKMFLSADQQIHFTVPECRFPGCPDFRGPVRNDWYVETFGSFDLPSKRLQDNSAKLGFVNRKDTSETMMPSFTFGVRFSKNISRDWLVKTGLHFSQINERFDYRNENEKRITTVITIRTIIRGPGDTLVVRDTSYVEQTGTRVKRTYNTYRNIDIPLLLSYEVRNPDFTVGVQGGLLFNVRSWYRGDMLDTTLIPMSQTIRDPKTQLKTTMGVGVYAGVSFVKRFTDTWEVFAEPWYRRYLQNHAVTDAPFRQNISSYGLQLGVRYKLNSSGQRW